MAAGRSEGQLSTRADDIVIETQRLVLRTWRDADVALMDRHCNTPAVMRWIGTLQSRDQIAAALGRMRALQAERGHCFWAMERKSDGAFLGFCGLKIAQDPGSTLQGEIEMGWRLRQDAWGKGYAKEAAAASLDFAFERLGAERVIAVTLGANEASWGLMERLGMRRAPHWDYREEVRGLGQATAIVYVIGRKEWRGC